MNDYHLKKDVCLVMPPFSVNTGPSLALGLLKAALTREGISSRVDYADLIFNTEVGIKDIFKLNSGEMTTFLGEYVFAEAAGIVTEKGEDEIRKQLSREKSPLEVLDIMGTMKKVKAYIPGFVEETARRILACNPKVVGASSCFQQRNGALAILKKVKELDPTVVTIMGGANCFGRAGLAILRTFDFVDYVFFGESDDIFGPVIKQIIENKADCENGGDGNEPNANGKSNADGSDVNANGENGSTTTEQLPEGVLSRKKPLPEEAPHHIVMDLDSLPYPDFDDFFDIVVTKEGESMRQSLKMYNTKESEMTLYMEGSRGCKWGECHPCTFCGLNGQHRIYRAKSPKRFFDELCYLSEKYGMTRVNLTDTLMPVDWPTELFPILKAYPVKFQLFTEMRTNFPPELMKDMREAGILFTQPGIESLSQHTLNLMNKGVTVMNNLTHLKYSKKYDISPAWNIIFGFPGETVEDYKQQIALIPLIEHYKGPNSTNLIVYARDSVYYNHADRYGLKLEPKFMYAFQAPADKDYQNDIAIYFDDAAHRTSPEIYEAAQKLHDAACEWQLRYVNLEGHIRLDYADRGRDLLVIDTRRCRGIRAQLLIGAERDIYLRCKTQINMKALLHLLDGKYSLDEVTLALNSLMRKKLLIKYGEHFFALAVEYTMQELVKREVEDFLFFRNRNKKLAQAFDEAMKAADAGSGEAMKDGGIGSGEAVHQNILDAISAFARSVGMCFTGKDLEDFFKGEL